MRKLNPRQAAEILRSDEWWLFHGIPFPEDYAVLKRSWEDDGFVVGPLMRRDNEFGAVVGTSKAAVAEGVQLQEANGWRKVGLAGLPLIPIALGGAAALAFAALILRK